MSAPLHRAKAALLCAMVALLAGPRAGARADKSGRHLTVEQVVESALLTHPGGEVAAARTREADGKLQARRGAFDPRLRARAALVPRAGEEYRVFSAELYQPLGFQGIDVYGGYLLGRGEFPPYKLDDKTGAGGELYVGARVPLLRNRAIDSARTEVARAELEGHIADLGLEREILLLRRDAAQAYWTWLSAGLSLRVERELLKLAADRQQLIEDAVRAGDQPRIALIDNERAVLRRKVRTTEAERKMTETTAKLSLYYRSAAGEPLFPTEAELPASYPAAPRAPAALSSLLAQAQAQRPDLSALGIEQARQELALELAKNQLFPALDGYAEYARGFEEVAPGYPQGELELGVKLDMAALFRAERGARQEAEARHAAAKASLRGGRDRVRAEVVQAHATFEAYAHQAGLSADLRTAAATLADAERAQFELGNSNLFVLNLRELEAADAALAEIAALRDVRVAEADLNATVAATAVDQSRSSR